MHAPFRATARVRQAAPAQCRYCGRQFFFKRGGRTALFCSQACRQADFRYARYLPSKRDESARKTLASSNACRSVFGDRPPPAAVVAAEIIDPHEWRTVTSSDGVTCQVARWRGPKR
jgi:endogenous inhibitor of DNA gyrase (YacG/DUF329 family)